MKTLFKMRVLFFIAVVMFIISACGPSPEEIAATETKVAESIFKTQTAKVPTATDTPLPTSTPTATQTPTQTPNRKATADAKSTESAQPMASKIQSLFEDDYLSSTEGEYFSLPDFTESFAQINFVRPYPTGFVLSDFVLRANIAWETAKTGANIRYSGCGFWFGVDENVENFHETMLALDGYVRLSRCLNNCSYLTNIASSYYGKIDYMKGDADVMLVVEGTTIQYFVNGQQIFKRENQKELTGQLTYALSSGTNAGFGTRCTFTDVELWDMGD